MAKFYNIDAENCDIEVLKNTIESVKEKVDFYNTNQLAAKTFINSVYGVFGTKFFNLSNINLAESVTLQGQDVIKYSVEQINYYFKNIWNQDYEGHIKIANTLRDIFGDAFKYDYFLECARENKIDCDTVQIYGDSVTGDSLVSLGNGMKMKIENLFNESCFAGILKGIEKKVRVQCCREAYVMSTKTWKIEKKKIEYIVRHGVRDNLYKISTATTSVTATKYHSIFILKNNECVVVKPDEIKVGDLLFINRNGQICFEGVSSVDIVETNKMTYVYDVAIESDDEQYHTFFANDILVHNTDSISFNSDIKTDKHMDGIWICDLFKENENNNYIKTEKGHEIVDCDECVLNYKDNNVVYSPIKKIIKHGVSKDKWRLITQTGKFVECTNDHSLIIFNDNIPIKISPSDIKYGDVVSLSNGTFDRVLTCEKIGNYNNEYVYDIEVDDESHTFYANDILVHNSAYITMQPIIDACKIPLEQELDFDLAIYNCVLSDYIDDKLNDYAKMYNCDKNLEKFELEKISRTIIMLAKKNYMCDVCWVETGARYDSLEHITYTGFDVVKGSTPDYCRDELKKFTEFVFSFLNDGKKPSMGDLVSYLRELKKRFSMQNPNEISKSTSISNYEDFIIDDKSKNIVYNERGEDGRKKACPIHVRAAAVYNNMLFNKAKKYLSKYNILKTGDKVRFYYVNSDDVFGFVPDNFPIEFALPMDIDVQFEKMLLSPINRIVVALGYKEISASLTYNVSLF